MQTNLMDAFKTNLTTEELLDRGLWPHSWPRHSKPYTSAFFARWEWRQTGSARGTHVPYSDHGFQDGSIEADAWAAGLAHAEAYWQMTHATTEE
jgi:hypothetical protein